MAPYIILISHRAIVLHVNETTGIIQFPSIDNFHSLPGHGVSCAVLNHTIHAGTRRWMNQVRMVWYGMIWYGMV